MLRSYVISSVLLLATAFPVEAKDGPNILLVMVDDMGFSDLGCYGSSIDTPVLDGLAANGLRFSSFYNTGRCWSTRAALMTGVHQHQAGKAMSFGANAPRAYQGNIPRSLPFLSELLHRQGYATYHLGKWHLNNRTDRIAESWPLGRGFNRSYCIASQNNFFAPWTMRDEDEIIRRPKDRSQWPSDYYITTALTDRAVENLDEHFKVQGDTPFFMYLAHTAPHFPLHAPQETIEKYLGTFKHGWDEERKRRLSYLESTGLVSGTLPERDEVVSAWETLTENEKDQWDVRMAIHAAMIDIVDQQLGRVINKLRQHQALENTLILFLSDNGASAEKLVRGDGHDPDALPGSGETYLCLEAGWSNAANSPFREHKMWMHEGGISTPLIVHWPKGVRKSGAISHQVGHVLDIVPTLAEVAGFDLPEHVHYQGSSLLRAIKKPQQRDTRVLFWEHVGNKALRIGDLKIVQELGKPWELYNIAEDRTETNDLSQLLPTMLTSMVKFWDDTAREIGVVEWDRLEEFHPNYAKDYRRK